MAVASVPTSGRARIPPAIMLAVGVGLLIVERSYRELEVRLAGAILNAVTPSSDYVAGDRETVYFGLGGAAPFGLRMTPECSSVFLLLPLLLVTALMLYFRPAHTRRLFFSMGISAIAVILVNQLRIFMIVWLVGRFGTDTGYYWGHTLLGSMVSVFGGAVSLVLFVWLATRRSESA